MEANELRIGNYVSYRGETICIVTNIGSYGFETVKDDNIGNLYGSTYIEYYEPIPLTEQWLMDFGFRKEGNTIFYIDLPNSIDSRLCVPMANTHKNVYIESSQYDWDCMENNYCTVKTNITKLHQLQNLYFALTGDELEHTDFKQDT